MALVRIIIIIIIIIIRADHSSPFTPEIKNKTMYLKSPYAFTACTSLPFFARNVGLTMQEAH
jgi:hypothetical protein